MSLAREYGHLPFPPDPVLRGTLTLNGHDFDVERVEVWPDQRTWRRVMRTTLSAASTQDVLKALAAQNPNFMTVQLDGETLQEPELLRLTMRRDGPVVVEVAYV